MTTPILGPAYRITTPRLLIRCPQPTDAQALNLAIQQSLDHLRPWLLWAKQEPVSLDQRIEFLRCVRGNFDQGQDFGYLVFNPDETLVLGGTGLHTRLGPDALEIGYWIHKDYTNRGFATEVASALTKIAFEINQVKRVEIHCNPDNTRSASIPRKLGFTHEATLHNRIDDGDGGLRDSMIWSLFIEDYPSSPGSRMEVEAFDVIGRKIL